MAPVPPLFVCDMRCCIYVFFSYRIKLISSIFLSARSGSYFFFLVVCVCICWVALHLLPSASCVCSSFYSSNAAHPFSSPLMSLISLKQLAHKQFFLKKINKQLVLAHKLDLLGFYYTIQRTNNGVQTLTAFFF